MFRPTNVTELVEKFPKFTPAQIEFIKSWIALCERERLDLDPGSTEKHIYDLQYVSIKAVEDNLDWLIRTNKSIEQAEIQERITDQQYSAQDIESMADGNEEIEIDDIQSYL